MILFQEESFQLFFLREDKPECGNEERKRKEEGRASGHPSSLPG